MDEGRVDINQWEDMSSPFFPLSGSMWATIPLEAWRRGLEVHLQPGNRYSISDGTNHLCFLQTRLTSEKWDALARRSDSKAQAKEDLAAHGIPVAGGQHFRAPFNDADVMRAAADIGYPVVLKANAWAKARGVYVNLRDETALSKALTTLTGELGCRDFVVEKHIPGEALRLFVVGDAVHSVVHTVAANVVGDGRHTISQLTDAKNELRDASPYLRMTKLSLSDGVVEHLRESGWTHDSVPPAGTRVDFGLPANVTNAADPEEVLGDVHPHIKELAVRSVEAAGLQHGAVDIITTDYTSDTATTVVCEVNASGGLGSHWYPQRGERRDIPTQLINHYFPGSQRLAGAEHWHFALGPIRRLFTSHTASDVQLTPMPVLADPQWQTLTVKTTEQEVPVLRRQLMSKLRRHRVHGSLALQRRDGLIIKIVGDGPRAINRAVREVRTLTTVTTSSKTPFVAVPGLRSV